jgi:predicted TIM-barrel fold metal-dependent hydrolase
VILNCLTLFEMHCDPYYQAGVASAINDWLRHEWLPRDERLRASIVVPWSDPDGAIAEMERVGSDPRFVQVLLPIRVDASWGKKAHHRMYAAALEHGVGISLHAWGALAKAPTASGFTTTYIEDYLSNAAIVQVHLTSLVAEGVFVRFPDLKVVLGECGFAWLPPLVWRMDKDWRGIWPVIP